MALADVLARAWWRCGVRVVHAGRLVHSDVRRARRGRDMWTLYVLFEGSVICSFAQLEATMVGPCAWLVPPHEPFRESGIGRVDEFVASFYVQPEPGVHDPLADLVHPISRRIAEPERWSAWCDEAAACFDDFDWRDLDSAIRARIPVDRLLTAWLAEHDGAGVQRAALAADAPGWLRDLVQWLIAHAKDPAIDHPRIVRESGVSTSHLHHVFQRYCGTAPLRFLRAERMRLAARLLETRRECAIAEVALACGYRDPTLFGRHFKQTHGCTPRDWRRYGGLDELAMEDRPALESRTG